MKKVKILWTGGWDSTFRIVELSRMKVEIQPIYIIDNNRKSLNYEKLSMEKIIDALKNKNETKAKILDVKYVIKEEIPENLEITEAYKKIAKVTNLGSQHEWLARYAYLNPGIEIGTEAGNRTTSHIIHAIEDFCSLKIKDEIGIIDKNASTREGFLVLGNFTYPIITKYETDMVELIQDWGYEDVMNLIWFCHTPINDKPCGFCHPCHVKMESNMSFLLDDKAKKNYKISRFFIKIFGNRFGNKVLKLYKKICRKV